jgi:hypothetical protein
MNLDDVRLKAATDAEFRSQLLSNPRPILEAAGLSIPDDFAINIVETSGAEITIPIAPLVSNASALDDAVLEQMAAGWCICSSTSCNVSGD